MYNKYHSHPVNTSEGKFDSEFEYEYWLHLKMLARKGEITDLQRQVVFELIPKQTITIRVPLKTKVKLKEVTVEHPCTYKADFVYYKDGERYIVDTKGFKTPEYKIKRKLMRYQGNPITEVSRKSIAQENKKKILSKKAKNPK